MRYVLKSSKEMQVESEVEELHRILGISSVPSRCAAERDRLRQQLRRQDSEMYKAMVDYNERMSGQPSFLQSRICYELSKYMPTRGHSFGSYVQGAECYYPFTFCGWADYGQYQQGMGYRINRECFADDEVELYYTDEDLMRLDDDDPWDWMSEMLEPMIECSSGLSDVTFTREPEHVATPQEMTSSDEGLCLPCEGWWFRFRLSAANIKPTVKLSGHEVSTDELGGYVLVVPRSGEFECELGKVQNGSRLVLHTDDFCMK